MLPHVAVTLAMVSLRGHRHLVGGRVGVGIRTGGRIRLRVRVRVRVRVRWG